jgi:MFS family permease
MELTQAQTAALTKKRWIILIASCLINLCIGSMYAWSSLSAPMAVELGVESTVLSPVFSTANAVGFITMIIGGLLNDKYGPRWVMFVGGLMFGVGMFTCSFAQSVFHLTLSYGICLGLGLSLVYGCTISNTIKFFPDKRGMVGGMTTAFYGISSVIFAPVAEALSNAYGARNTFKILGVLFLVIICAGSFLMQKCPAGFVPTGYVAPVVTTTKKVGDKTPGEMLRMPIFYVMLLMLTCGGTFGMMIISNARGIAMNMVGASTATATLFVSVLCLFNTAGRLVAGSLSDKLGRINTLTVALVIALIGLVVLFLAANTGLIALFAVGVVLIGICFGTFMGVFPGFCTDQFGTKNNTVNYGIMWIGFSLAGIVGPTILTKVYSATGAYQMAFLIAIGIAVLGMVLTFVYRALNKKQ